MISESFMAQIVAVSFDSNCLVEDASIEGSLK
jgi:hypothetical protein